MIWSIYSMKDTLKTLLINGIIIINNEGNINNHNHTFKTQDIIS